MSNRTKVRIGDVVVGHLVGVEIRRLTGNPEPLVLDGVLADVKAPVPVTVSFERFEWCPGITPAELSQAREVEVETGRTVVTCSSPEGKRWVGKLTTR